MASAALSLGDRAPAFSLTATDGTTVRLSDLRGKRVVLYFYPKDDTPGCTKEACGFQASLKPLRAAGAIVLGVSRDDLASHRKFSSKFTLTFPLLSDPDGSVCKAYGVYKRKALYGRTFLGIERTTFLINEAGRIAAIFPRVRVDGHIDEVLHSLRSLRSLHSVTPPHARSAASTRAGAH